MLEWGEHTYVRAQAAGILVVRYGTTDEQVPAIHQDENPTKAPISVP